MRSQSREPVAAPLLLSLQVVAASPTSLNPLTSHAKSWSRADYDIELSNHYKQLQRGSAPGARKRTWRGSAPGARKHAWCEDDEVAQKLIRGGRVQRRWDFLRLLLQLGRAGVPLGQVGL